MFTSRFPYPLEKGDKLRAYHQIKELSNHFEVHLFSITEHKVKQEHLDELKKYLDENPKPTFKKFADFIINI